MLFVGWVDTAWWTSDVLKAVQAVGKLCYNDLLQNSQHLFMH